MIFNNTNMMFIEFIKSETMVGELRASISRQNRTLLEAIATRRGEAVPRDATAGGGEPAKDCTAVPHVA